MRLLDQSDTGGSDDGSSRLSPALDDCAVGAAAAGALDADEAAGGDALTASLGASALSAQSLLLLLLLLLLLVLLAMLVLLLEGVKQSVRLSGCVSGSRPLKLGRYSAGSE